MQIGKRLGIGPCFSHYLENTSQLFRGSGASPRVSVELVFPVEVLGDATILWTLDLYNVGMQLSTPYWMPASSVSVFKRNCTCIMAQLLENREGIFLLVLS